MEQGFTVCVRACMERLYMFFMWYFIVLIYSISYIVFNNLWDSLHVFPFALSWPLYPPSPPSDNVSCHRVLIYLGALFIDTCTSTKPLCPPPVCYRLDCGVPLRFTVLLQQHSLPTYISSWKRSRLDTWPAIWRGPGGYPKQAKHNPITPQGDTPHLLNSAWVIFCFSLGACKDPLTCSWTARNKNQQMFYKVQTPAAFDCYTPFLLRIWLLWVWFKLNMFHSAEETIRVYFVSAHLSKIRCGLRSDLQGWGDWAGLNLNKQELAGGKMTARRLKVKHSLATWLAEDAFHVLTTCTACSRFLTRPSIPFFADPLTKGLIWHK